MNSSARSHVASSFTLIKGAMIDETYAVFAAWDFALSKRENLDRLRRENFIGASTTTWLRDVAKVLNRRFDPNARDRALALLAKSGCPIDEWKPLLLWHITRDEFLLRDFLLNWLFPTFVSGTYSRSDRGPLRAPSKHREEGWNDRTRLEQDDREPGCGRIAQDGGRLWLAARQRRQRIRELPSS